MSKEIEDYYNSQVSRKVKDYENGNDRVKAALARISTIIANHEPRKVLEIGCGIGGVSYKLAKQFPKTNFTGLDPCPDSLVYAKEHFKSSNLKFIRGYLEDTEEIQYDLVFLVDVLEHIDIATRKQFLQGIRKRISDHAQIFFSCPTPQNLDHTRIKRPADIQPIDNDIDLGVIAECENEMGLIAIYHERLSIWHQFDYTHTILAADTSMRQKAQHAPQDRPHNSLLKRVLRKIKP